MEPKININSDKDFYDIVSLEILRRENLLKENPKQVLPHITEKYNFNYDLTTAVATQKMNSQYNLGIPIQDNSHLNYPNINQQGYQSNNQGFQSNQYQNVGYQPPTTFTTTTGNDNLNQNLLPPISSNQMSSGVNTYEINNLQIALKSNSVFINCPYCNHQSLTKTERNCSASNTLCCICFGGVAWIIFQAVRGKDISCYDADHVCMGCGKNLANYKAC